MSIWYQHAAKTVTPNVATNDLENKVDVLENIVIEMAKKIGMLEAELEDMKSVQNKVKQHQL